jgi:transposase
MSLILNAVNQWIARYKKDGIKGLNEKPHTGRIEKSF